MKRGLGGKRDSQNEKGKKKKIKGKMKDFEMTGLFLETNNVSGGEEKRRKRYTRSEGLTKREKGGTGSFYF